jgi:hypothetical protein
MMERTVSPARRVPRFFCYFLSSGRFTWQVGKGRKVKSGEERSTNLYWVGVELGIPGEGAEVEEWCRVSS